MYVPSAQPSCLEFLQFLLARNTSPNTPFEVQSQVFSLLQFARLKTSQKRIFTEKN